MAYSNVGTPVFYIDNYLYHKTIGTNVENLNVPESLFITNPSIAIHWNLLDWNAYIPFNPVEYNYSGNMKFYIAYLNHNNNGSFMQISGEGDLSENNISSDFEEVLNGQSEGNGFHPKSGSTILTTSTAHDTSHYFTLFTDSVEYNNFFIGAYSSGIQYTMPYSPDLKLRMQIEMDGVNTIKTSSGGSISNIQYTGNPLWVNGESKTNPFDVYENTLDVTTLGARRNGRKSWSLKFSYLSDTDLFSSNPRASNYTEHPADSTYNSSDLEPLNTDGDPTSESKLAYNIETDDSFHAQVWNKTLGGALPFIFQPDSNHNDDFYICKFAQDSLSVSQSAFKVYDFSVNIVEVW